MAKLKSILAGVVLAAATVTAAPSMAANLIQNGGFDGGQAGLNNGFSTPGVGVTFAGFWTVDTANIDWISGYWQSSDADGYSVDLNGNSGAGAVKQTVATTIGDLYRLTFDLSKNTDGGTVPRDMFLEITGVAQQPYAFSTPNTRANMHWAAQSFDFIATSTSTTVLFRGSASGGSFFGPAIDNVALNAVVPEPATWAMMIGGFFGLGATLRQRRRSVA